MSECTGLHTFNVPGLNGELGVLVKWERERWMESRTLMSCDDQVLVTCDMIWVELYTYDS